MSATKKRRIAEKLTAGSFWLVMVIHIAAFTAIGLFTMRGWRLLVIFLCGLAVILSGVYCIALYGRRNPQKKWPRKVVDHIGLFR